MFNSMDDKYFSENGSLNLLNVKDQYLLWLAMINTFIPFVDAGKEVVVIAFQYEDETEDRWDLIEKENYQILKFTERINFKETLNEILKDKKPDYIFLTDFALTTVKVEPFKFQLDQLKNLATEHRINIVVGNRDCPDILQFEDVVDNSFIEVRTGFDTYRLARIALD